MLSRLEAFHRRSMSRAFSGLAARHRRVFSRRMQRAEQKRLVGFAGLGGTGWSQPSAAQISALIAARLIEVGVVPRQRLKRDAAPADELEDGLRWLGRTQTTRNHRCDRESANHLLLDLNRDLDRATGLRRQRLGGGDD